MLNFNDLFGIPNVEETTVHNSAVSHDVSINVTITLPWDYGSKVGWLKGGNKPLCDAIVRNSVQADFSVTPLLHTSPLNDVTLVSLGEKISSSPGERPDPGASTRKTMFQGQLSPTPYAPY